jgi:hypothetical protein
MTPTRKLSTFLVGAILSASLVPPCAAQADLGGTVFWSSVAAGCMPDRADLALIDAAHGTVSFAPNKSGRLQLTCPITFVVQPSFAQVLTFGVTFYNDKGFDGQVNHCTILGAFLRSNLNNVEGGSDMLDLGVSGSALTGRQVVTASNVAPPMDFATSYYWIFVRLTRDSTTAACNPVLVGAFISGNME